MTERACSVTAVAVALIVGDDDLTEETR